MSGFNDILNDARRYVEKPIADYCSTCGARLSSLLNHLCSGKAKHDDISPSSIKEALGGRISGMILSAVPKYTIEFVTSLKSFYNSRGMLLEEIRFPYVAYDALAVEVNSQLVAIGYGVSGAFKICGVNISKKEGHTLEIVACEAKK